MGRKRPADERFDEKVDRSGECWNWTAGVNPRSGYGVFHPSHGKTITAHRYAYERERGPLAPGLVPDHLCRNRLCVRVAHLEAVTNEENLRRGAGYRLANGMTNKCPAGHEYTESNTYRSPSRPHIARCRECARIADRKRAPRGRRNHRDGGRESDGGR